METGSGAPPPSALDRLTSIPERQSAIRVTRALCRGIRARCSPSSSKFGCARRTSAISSSERGNGLVHHKFWTDVSFRLRVDYIKEYSGCGASSDLLLYPRIIC